MSVPYERSVFSWSHYGTRQDPSTEGCEMRELPAEATEGGVCPRGCGGLIVLRVVVTEDGSCEELFCTGCSRSRLNKFFEPYEAMAGALGKGSPLAVTWRSSWDETVPGSRDQEERRGPASGVPRGPYTPRKDVTR
jgi:hypothetical protein